MAAAGHEVYTGIYLSQLLGKPIRDAQGARIARVKDLVVKFGTHPHPPVSGVVARAGSREFFIERSQIAEISDQGVRLNTFKVNLRPFERRDGEVLLGRDILDKQLIDIDGRKVIRANDLELGYFDGDYRLVGVDVSPQALLRRLGPAALTRNLRGTRVIDWEDVESFATDVPMVRLRVSHDKLSKLHPVDIAHILEHLSREQANEVLEALNDEIAADAVQEMAPADAADVMQALDSDRAADILEEMDPEDAADLLADLPKERANELLGLMEPEESEEVRELMAYKEGTAAGLMTNDFVALPANVSVGEALEALRRMEHVPDPLYHIYLVDDEERLAGVVALRDLVISPPSTPLAEIAQKEVAPAHPDDPAPAVAKKMAEYNLPTLPVVDDAGKLLGVVLFDDAMDLLIPEGWHHRLSQVFG